MNSAVPATLNLFLPSRAVTIFASSSSKLTHGALPGLLIVMLYPFTGYIGKFSLIVLASFLLPVPAQTTIGPSKSSLLILSFLNTTPYFISKTFSSSTQNLCISPVKSLVL